MTTYTGKDAYEYGDRARILDAVADIKEADAAHTHSASRLCNLAVLLERNAELEDALKEMWNTVHSMAAERDQALVRIADLEDALREIAEPNYDSLREGPTPSLHRAIARRALGKRA